MLDKTYSNGGKLDATEFATKLCLETTGLVDVIRTQLLEGHDEHKKIETELYKLNVYGKGSSDLRSLIPRIHGRIWIPRERFFLYVSQGYPAKREDVWIARHCVSDFS